jgi:hypothetical protein
VDKLQGAGINTVRIPVSRVSDPTPRPSLIAVSAWVLDRRRPGQPDHRVLPPWGAKVSGLLCTSIPSLASDGRSPGKWSRHAPRSGNTSHPGSSRASWCPGRQPGIRGEVRISL